MNEIPPRTNRGGERHSNIVHSSEKIATSSAFITHNTQGIWRIELKQAVPISLGSDEQIEQVKNYGYLAECNDVLARAFGHGSTQEMMRFSGDKFPEDLFTDTETLLQDFIKSDYRLENIKSVRQSLPGEIRRFATDVFGIVDNRRLTEIWGIQREEKNEKNARASGKRESYQTVIDSMIEHIAVINQNGDIIATNDAWKRFSRNNSCPSKQNRTDVGINYFDICSADAGELARQVKAGIQNVLGGQQEYFTLEYPCFGPNGDERWFLLHVTPLSGTSDAIVSHLNITKRKKAEQEYEKAVSELREAIEENQKVSRMKDEFLSVVSHELRTPLTSMLGWTRLLQSGKLDEKTAAHGLEIIERNTLVQSRLIEDLLDVSRIINGKIRLDAHPFKLRSQIESAVDSVKATASLKQITIEFDSEIEDASVYADARRIQQILWNLLSNAIKFTPRSGFVLVKMRAADDNAVEVSVKDNGIGIAPEFLPNLFSHFRQQDSSTTRRHGGLGLGLSIVRHLVELHGGKVEAQSAGEGAGATFSFTLPVMNAVVEKIENVNNFVASDGFTSQSKETETPQKLAGADLLVVEDDQDSLELLVFLFEAAGAKVRTANLARLGFEKFTEKPPDLLISDIGMPDEDGYSLIQRIRALSPEEGGNVPAIALTAFAKNEDRLKALSKGFQRHIKKPIEPLDLIKQVGEMLEQKKNN